jgi:geranylgeranyl pyrophosphate synthase
MNALVSEQKTELDFDRIAQHLETELDAVCDTGWPELSGDLRRIVFSGGKRLRPRLAWLCASMGGAKSTQVLPLMVLLELTHTASLIHDDVVDDAPRRRGVDTIHVQRGRAAAIHSGDYLLGRAMEYLRTYSELGLDKIVSNMACEMCIGEYMQQDTAFSLEQQTLEQYFLRIKRKTALFLKACCLAGAKVGGLPEEVAEALGEFGLNLGMAFQICDDLLDYSGAEKTGKKAGQDLRCGVYNLPFLCAAQRSPDPEMQTLAEKRKKTNRDIELLNRYVISSGGLAEARRVAGEFTERALDALERVPEGQEKENLRLMAQALFEREA